MLTIDMLEFGLAMLPKDGIVTRMFPPPNEKAMKGVNDLPTYMLTLGNTYGVMDTTPGIHIDGIPNEKTSL